MFFSLVTLPSGSQFLSDLSDTSGASFDELYPIGLWGLGWIAGSLLALFVVLIVAKAVYSFFHNPPGHGGASHEVMDRQWAHHNASQRYTAGTDDRSTRGDFLHGGS